MFLKHFFSLGPADDTNNIYWFFCRCLKGVGGVLSRSKLDPLLYTCILYHTVRTQNGLSPRARTRKDLMENFDTMLEKILKLLLPLICVKTVGTA